jgi:hypothetical protein
MFGLVTALMAAESAPTARNDPTLADTLQWLSGASDVESGDGKNHHSFETDAKDSSVAITETRTEASRDFWIRISFSLADIDPADIRVNDLGKGDFPIRGQFAVDFHTTNYVKKIMSTSNTPTSDYIYFTNDWFAPKFANAFKHAVEFCGGKPSSF